MSEPAPQEATAPSLAALTLIAVIFINMLGFGIIVPLLPFYAKSFSAEAWQIALVFSAYSAGAFFGEPLWGRLSDKYGRKHVRFEFATGAFQIAIVLASASIITGIAALLWAAGGLGGVGLLLLIAGMIA